MAQRLSNETAARYNKIKDPTKHKMLSHLLPPSQIHSEAEIHCRLILA